MALQCLTMTPGRLLKYPVHYYCSMHHRLCITFYRGLLFALRAPCRLITMGGGCTSGHLMTSPREMDARCYTASLTKHCLYRPGQGVARCGTLCSNVPTAPCLFYSVHSSAQETAYLDSVSRPVPEQLSKGVYNVSHCVNSKQRGWCRRLRWWVRPRG